MRGYWLAHYFPEMIDQGASGIPSSGKMNTLLGLAGFGAIQAFPYFVTDDLQDKMM